MPLHDMPLDPRFNFQAQDIDAFWGQSVALQPMFSAEAAYMSQGGGPMVRATQTSGMQFSQTQTQLPEDLTRPGVVGAYLVSSFMPDSGLTQAAATQSAGVGGGSAFMAVGGKEGGGIRPAMLLAERGSQASLGLTSVGAGGMSGGGAWSVLRPAQSGPDSSQFYIDQYRAARDNKTAQLLKLKNERRSQVQMFRK